MRVYIFRMTAVVAAVTKKELDANQTYMIFEICASDEDGEDVEVSIV